MIWRRNWRFSKYGNFSAPAGKFPFGVRRRNLWRKDSGVPGGTVPFRYGEAKGIFSFEKRMSPRPPKEKRGGISISPRTPLKRHKGAGCGPPLWKPFLGEGDGPRLWKPLLGMGSGSGKRSRGCPICTLRFDATISTAYKAGQALHPARDLVRNSSPAQQFSQNPFPQPCTQVQGWIQRLFF